MGLQAFKTISKTLAEVYPVGSVYISVSPVSPSDLFGGEWEEFAPGQFLLGSSSSHPAGTTGGEETHTLTVDELPVHSHSGTVSLSGTTGSGGSHSHSGSAASVTGHSHSRGTMNITGTLTDAVFDVAGGTGAFSTNNNNVSPYGGGTAANLQKRNASFSASSSWSGSTSSGGSHSHSLSVSSSGSHSHDLSGVSASLSTSEAGAGGAHNNMPPFISVYMWTRIA